MVLSAIFSEDETGTDDAATETADTTTVPAGEATTTQPAEVEADVTTTVADTTTTSTVPETTTTTIPVIEAGTYVVGDEIAPGTYRVAGYWARLDAALEIIDNDLVSGDGFSLVNVLDTDSFIEISQEAVALADVPSIDPIALGFDTGTYLVGADIAPGQYRVTATGSSAYAARLDATLEIIDNDLNQGSVIVIVEPGDFALSYSGTLELIG